MPIYIWVESHHIHNSPFLFVLLFYWSYYSRYYLEYVISLQIKSSLVPISNHPIDLALTLKEKNYTDNTLGKVFLLNSVRRLQKLSDLYRWGALLQEFGVRGKPRSVEHTDAALNVIQYAYLC